MSRWRAATINLFISVAVLSSTLGLMLLTWYPRPYFTAVGGNGLLQILTAVELVLGPMITLVIFKSGKKGMKGDLIIIGALQLAALVYGLYVIGIARPAFVVFTIDRFELPPANTIDFSGASGEFASAPWSGPRFAAAVPPDDYAERDKLLDLSLTQGIDLQHLARHYRRYEDVATQAAAAGKPLAVLQARHPESAPAVTRLLQRAGLGADAVVFLPLVARKKDMSVLLHGQRGDVLGIVSVDPWDPNGERRLDP